MTKGIKNESSSAQIITAISFSFHNSSSWLICLTVAFLDNVLIGTLCIGFVPSGIRTPNLWI